MFHRIVPCLLALFLAAESAAAQCTPVEVLELLPDPQTYARFGNSAVLFGETAFVGAVSRSNVYVFERHAGGANVWGRVKKLQGATVSTEFGRAVAIDGDVALVSESRANTSVIFGGAVHVLERDAGGPGNWGATALLVQSDSATNDYFSFRIAISEDTVFVAAQGDDTLGTDAGAIYLYERDHGGPDNWGEVMKILASDGETDDGFGTGLALVGDTLMVGTPGDDDDGAQAGAIYVLERDQGGPNQWGEVKKLTPGSAFNSLGSDLALHQDTLAARGAGTHVFERDAGAPGNWGEVTRIVEAGRLGLFGDTIAVGKVLDGDCRQYSGSAHVYQRHQGGPGAWGEVGEFYASDCARLDNFGSALAVGRDVVLIGSQQHDHVGMEGGAVYVLSGFDPTPPTTYCTAGVSASGCMASLSASGTPSATAASGFDLIARTVEGRKDGIFYFSANGRQANPWGNSSSFQCVVQPVARAALMTGVGSVGACDGSFVYDLNTRWQAAPNQNPGAGAVVGAQLWYRDPASSSNRFTSLSDALELVVCP